MADDNYVEIIHKNNEETINQQQENDSITDENDQDNLTNNHDAPEHDPEDTYNNIQTIPEEEKNESDEYVTISDINIMSEMNASTWGSESEPTENKESEIRTNEQYNL